MRVLLTLHHRLGRDAGAPGVTLELGRALERAGCEVEHYAFDQAFRGSAPESVARQLCFPWLAAAWLARHGSEFDVVDSSTGDAWLWSGLRRGRTALVTRAHGLEHVARERDRRLAREGGPALSWKFPLYHGGLRLWEVRRSLTRADHCVLLNSIDRDYACERLGVPRDRTSVIQNGIGDQFLRVPAPAGPGEGPPRLAFIGRWTTHKGKDALVEAVTQLHERGVELSLSVFGAGPAAAVRRDLPEGLRLELTPEFSNADLPELLAGHELFVFPSLSEGSSGALLEAMACGLAPVATAVGAAPEIIDAANGVLVQPGDAAGIVEVVERLSRDRAALLALRLAARETAQRFGWDDVAARTLEVYRGALAARSTASTKPGATLRQV